VRMKQPWDPAHEDFTKLVRQIEDGARFAGYVNNPFSDTQLVKIAEKIILDTKMLKAEYKDWMRIAPAARNWNAFKDFWADAHTTWLTTEKASGDFGYGGGATGNNVQARDDVEVYDVDNINAATNAANAATFQQLSQANNTLTQENSLLRQQLQMQMQNANQMQQFANAANQAPRPPAQPTYQAPPVQYQAPPAPAPVYQPVQQYTPQPYVQQQQYTPQQSYGGRGGRGNRGRGGYGRGYGGRGGYGRGYGGRGGGRGYQTQQQPPQAYDPNAGFYQAPAAPMNPVKRHNNWYYCWSHGFDVDHESHQCMDRRWGHQDGATRMNTMGGCQAKKHKTQLPSNNMYM
jgi:hypothetical protein